MDASDERTAERLRAEIARGERDPPAFRAALSKVAPAARDAWVDRAFGLTELPDDGPSLPRDGVPYLPCPVDALLRVVDLAPVLPSDVFVDLGAGVGRAAALVHFLTGASAVGVEIQPHLVLAARDLVARLATPRITIVEGDAVTVAGSAAAGSVFFLYCPFSGARLSTLLDTLEPRAGAPSICICTVDLPLPTRHWLVADPLPAGDLAIYRATPARE